VARDGGVLLREGRDFFHDGEQLDQGLPPKLSSFRQLRVNFRKVYRANDSIHQYCGNFVCSCFSVEKRQ